MSFDEIEIIELREYNGKNQLIKVYKDGKNIIYSYKSDGMRYSKTIDDIRTTHVWDGQNIVLDISGNNRVKGRYLRGSSLSARVQDNQTHYYLHNAHGDVVYLIDQNSNMIKHYDYSAFGIENKSEKNDSNTFRYCGEYYDGEIKNIYLRARYYNPRIGRFTSEDPARDGNNWYVYCYGNPVSLVDPNGKTPQHPDSNVNDNPFLGRYDNELGWGREDGVGWKIGSLDDNGLNFIANLERNPDQVVVEEATGNITRIDRDGVDIGYGYDLEKNNGVPEGYTESMSAQSALELLKTYSGDVIKGINKDLSVSFTQDQLNGVVAMRYNFGYLSEVDGLIEYLEGGEYDREEFDNLIWTHYENIMTNNPDKEQYRSGWRDRLDSTMNIFFDGNYGKMPIDAINGRVRK